MKTIPLQSHDFDDLENDPIYFSVINESGEKVYAAKMDAVQIAILSYSVGEELIFGSLNQEELQKHYISQVTKFFVRNGKKHELHLQLIVKSDRPKRVLTGPDNS
jgi:hypothetical protein